MDYTVKLVQKLLQEKGGNPYDELLSRFFKCQEGETDEMAKITWGLVEQTSGSRLTVVVKVCHTLGNYQCWVRVRHSRHHASCALSPLLRSFTIAALFHYLLTDPRSMRILRQEIDSTNFESQLDVGWEEARQMPIYTD